MRGVSSCCNFLKIFQIEIMNAELKLVKEFRKKRALMQKELDEVGFVEVISLSIFHKYLFVIRHARDTFQAGKLRRVSFLNFGVLSVTLDI